MIIKSGHQLEEQAIKFVKNENSVTLLIAYIKLEQLKKINLKQNINQIVVRWEIQDLCTGASDIEIYDYCKENKITLYRNTRIHLKVIWNNYNSVLFGSANMSSKGIGEKGNYNYELNGFSSRILIEDKIYFKKIINQSELVDSALYKKLKKLKEKIEKKAFNYPDLKTNPNLEDKFLLSQLPMSSSPKTLLYNFFHRHNLSEIDEACMIQDLSNYDVDINLSKDQMEEQLEYNFNTHPFISAFKDAVFKSQNKSINYGGVVRWIQENTTTVPTPRSWELKKDLLVNILYQWICDFDNNFYWNIPGEKSQVIYYTKKRDHGEIK